MTIFIKYSDYYYSVLYEEEKSNVLEPTGVHYNIGIRQNVGSIKFNKKNSLWEFTWNDVYMGMMALNVAIDVEKKLQELNRRNDMEFVQSHGTYDVINEAGRLIGVVRKDEAGKWGFETELTKLTSQMLGGIYSFIKNIEEKEMRLIEDLTNKCESKLSYGRPVINEIVACLVEELKLVS